MIKIFCDRCGKEITKCNRIGYISLNSRDQREGDLTDDNEFEKNAYCSSCMNQIREFIKCAPGTVEEDGMVAPCDQNIEKRAENEEKCAKTDENGTEKVKKRVDKGKIIALKKAGWSNKDIAGEMALDPQTVANVVYQYKKKSPDETATVMKPIQKGERPKL